MSYNSHEQDELRKVLLKTYGENWTAWKTDYVQGIEQIQDWWTPVDKETPNPFRPEIDGRCRLVFVAPDAEYSLAYNERLSEYFVTSSDTEKGFLSGRKEIGAYHYPQSELGKAVKAMRPLKEFDNIVDPIRGYAVMWSLSAPALTETDKLELALPKSLRREIIEMDVGFVPDKEIDARRIARDIKINFENPLRSGKSREKVIESWDDLYNSE